MLLLIISILVLWLFYDWYTRIYRQWEIRGIDTVSTSFPFGSDIDLALYRRYAGYCYDKMYRQKSDVPYFGMFIVREPQLVIRDPEIIKLVLTKEFSHFRDRLGYDVIKEDILSHHLFALQGDKWRALRVKLSPTYTSGKMKKMFSIFIDCAEELDKLLKRNLESTIDVKDVFGRFTTDTICSCAFGLEVNSVGNAEDRLRQMGRGFSKLSLRSKMRFLIRRAFPSLFDLFKIRLFPKTIEEFLLQIITETVAYRDKNNVKRNDFLDLLMQLRYDDNIIDDMAELYNDEPVQPIEMTIELMTAQCYVFFFAGFETSSSVQTYCLYELAINPDIQERLRTENDKIINKHGGVTYEAIHDMQYLDMVISETLRKYPTVIFLTRRCTKPFTMPNGHTIFKGDTMLIPVWSLHHDPLYFPEPEKFDPERFSPENKELIKPYTYLPFGEGPRICIGMRFGLIQTKIGLITALRKYKFEASKETPIPLELSAASLLTSTKDPIVLKVTKRTDCKF